MRFDLSPREVQFLDQVRAFAQDEVLPQSRAWDDAQEFPPEIWPRMGQVGLLGITLPEAAGGHGFGPMAYVEAVREVAQADPALAMNIAATNALVLSHIARFGNDEQRQRWLPGCVTGNVGMAWALTEPDAGSDAKRVASTATAIPGKPGQFRLNGEKMFITNAGRADVIVVIARGSDGELSGYLMETAQPGFTVKERMHTVGVRASHTTWFTMTDAIAEATPCTFADALSMLQLGRLGIAGMAVGIAEKALAEMIHYANGRVQFDRKLSDMQSVQNMIADSVVEVTASRLLTHDGALRLTAGEDVTAAASMAKLYASETATRVTNRAVQVHGGRGMSVDYLAEKLWRDAKLTEIGEGCSEIQRMIIARAATKPPRPKR